MIIIEVLFVIIFVFYLIRISFPWVIRFLIKRFIKKVSREHDFNKFYQSSSTKNKSSRVKNPDKDLEYIDYEEID